MPAAAVLRSVGWLGRILGGAAGSNDYNVDEHTAPHPRISTPQTTITMSANAKTLAAIDAKYADRLSQMTETEKANLGLPYLANEPAMVRARLKARRLMLRYNQSAPSSFDPPDLKEGEQAKGVGASDNDDGAPPAGVASEERREILAELLGVERSELGEVEIEVCANGQSEHESWPQATAHAFASLPPSSHPCTSTTAPTSSSKGPSTRTTTL